MENKGYTYILTNPSFKEYVKIGYKEVKHGIIALVASAVYSKNLNFIVI